MVYIIINAKYLLLLIIKEPSLSMKPINHVKNLFEDTLLFGK